MAETFLERYNDELFALRRRAEKFARAFPKIAGRLRLSGDVADDPHVERIIQSFAYSAARVRQKLDDEFPELTDSLLETLYPHYLAPVPPMSIVQFAPGATLAGMQLLPRHTDIVTEPVGGDPCQFRTTQDVEIVPMTVSNASLTGLPLDAPATPFAGAAGVLRLSLRSTAPKQDSMAGLGVKRLTFSLPPHGRRPPPCSSFWPIIASAWRWHGIRRIAMQSFWQRKTCVRWGLRRSRRCFPRHRAVLPDTGC